MVVVIGTNSGFVTTAPTVDPAHLNFVVDGRALVTLDTSPETAGKITEMGWWCDTASQESNFEIGLYAADGATVPGEAGTLLYVDTINAKGTTAGWKSVAVDWEIDPSTDYWLGVQLDNVATSTNTNYASTNGKGYDLKTAQTTLTNPFGGGAIANSNYAIAIYAVWEAAVVGPANLKSVNAVTTANIKSINAVLIANVKSINAVA